MAFFILLFIVLITVFFALLSMVKKGVNISEKQTAAEQPGSLNPSTFGQDIQPETPPAAQPPDRTSTEKPVKKPPAAPVKEAPAKKVPPEKPAEQTPPQSKPRQPVSQPPPVSPPAERPVETRDRNIYFIQEQNGGADLSLVKVNRKLAASNSPLIDSINALLAGPSAEEKRRGLISLVPPNTRLLSARVANNTVFLNFNEEFRYITEGRQGGEAQLKQIVWTATEFPNVRDVQFQIGGNTVDFLIEGITIRNPIGR